MALSCLRLGNYSISLLPPRNGDIPSTFTSVCCTPSAHEARVWEIQKFRGRIYFADGAIRNSALDEHGRHVSAADADSWHLFVTREDDAVCGCMRVRLFDAAVDIADLNILQIIARLPEQVRQQHVRCMKQVRDQAARSFMLFGEAGGWAVAEELRAKSAGVTLAVAVWPLCRLLGGVIAIAAATARHNSARILTRLGGVALSDGAKAVEPFYDDYFRCQMHMMSFDSRRLAPQYEKMATILEEHFATTTLVMATAPVSSNVAAMA